MELDRAIDTLTSALVSYGREAGWIPELFGEDEVDLLEAARLDIFQRIKLPFRSYWAWQLAAASEYGSTWKVPCPDLRRSDVVKLAQYGRELGLSVELQESDQVMYDISAERDTLNASLSKRFADGLKRRFYHMLPSVDPPSGHGSERILYEDFYPNNVHVMTPLYKGLECCADVNQVYVSLRPSVDRELRHAEITSFPLYRCRPEGRRDLDAWTAKYADRIHLYVERWVAEAWPVSWVRPTNELQADIARVTVHALERAHDYSGRFRRVLDVFRPTTVVVSTDFSVDARVLELLARQRGIRSVSIQHGLFYEKVRPKYFLADEICVWGSYHAKFFEGLPDRQERVVITGSPKHDRLRERAANNPRRERPLIVYASTPITISPGLSRNDYVKTVKDVVHASKAMPHCDFVVKMHPSENPYFARQLCIRFGAGANLCVTDEENVYDLIEQSSAVIVVSSTLGYEAMLMQRPVVILNLTGEDDWLPFQKHGTALGVRKEKELPTILEQVLNVPAKKIDAARYWHDGGDALERCLSIIAGGSAETTFKQARSEIDKCREI
ncbi:MAG: hypothetical protein WD423_07755 [Rhodothermales bacterium]